MPFPRPETELPVHFENEVTAPLPAIIPDLPPAAPTPYLSLQWRILIPLMALFALIIGIGAYFLSDALTRGYDDNERNDLLSSTQKIATELQKSSDHHHREIFRIMNTDGVRENIAGRSPQTLQSLVEPNALLANLDLVIITAGNGAEILGLQQTLTADDTLDYTVTTATDLSDLSIIDQVLIEHVERANSLARSNQGPILLSAQPVYSPADQVMGVIVVGTRLDHLLANLAVSVQLSLFAPDGTLLRTTLPDDADVLQQLSLPKAQAAAILTDPTHTQTANATLAEQRYQMAYLPFLLDTQSLGILGVYRPSTTPFATENARQTFRIIATVLAIGMTLLVYLGLARIIKRLDKVQSTAQALAADESAAPRSHLLPNDEIGQLAQTLDSYADSLQQRHEQLDSYLQRQKHESARLTALVENIPQALVLLDLQGRVLMMNTFARQLIGDKSNWRKQNFQRLTAIPTDQLGASLAPGVYALGDPTRIPYGEKVLQAQTAVVMAANGQKIGLVVTLRDISAEVERGQRYERLLDELDQQVQVPIAHIAQDAALTAANHAQSSSSAPLLTFARQIARNARAMQRIIAELREVSLVSPHDPQSGQTSILLSHLLWQIAVQWKPAATAANLEIAIQNPTEPCHILGDEPRLIWAIGHILDNAIKYSPPDTTIQIIGQESSEGHAHIQIIDAGIGISPADLPHIFKRYYRGQTPTAQTLPAGTGQGLFLAQQVIEAHGGQILLESQPATGTSAHLYLPLTAPITLEMPENADTVAIPIEASENVDAQT